MARKFHTDESWKADSNAWWATKQSPVAVAAASVPPSIVEKRELPEKPDERNEVREFVAGCKCLYCFGAMTGGLEPSHDIVYAHKFLGKCLECCGVFDVEHLWTYTKGKILPYNKSDDKYYVNFLETKCFCSRECASSKRTLAIFKEDKKLKLLLAQEKKALAKTALAREASLAKAASKEKTADETVSEEDDIAKTALAREASLAKAASKQEENC
jgi:hypothetical protein